MFRRVPFVAAVLIGAASIIHAQTASPQRQPAAVTASATVTLTAEIQAIDSATRVVTLKHADGLLESIYCGPEVQRFNELKVGQKVTFTYHEAMIASIAAPGAASKEPATTVVRGTGDKPAAIMAQKMSAVVTVLAIDPKVPSVTIQREDGSKMSFKVETPKAIEGLKAGDKVQITYTQGIAVSVK
jgi:Cu/Ag efflux protein CusF